MGRHGPRGDCGCCGEGETCKDITVTAVVSGFPSSVDCDCSIGGGTFGPDSSTHDFSAINGTYVASLVASDSPCSEFVGWLITLSSSLLLCYEASVSLVLTKDIGGTGYVAELSISTKRTTLITRNAAFSTAISDVGDSETVVDDVELCAEASSGVPLVYETASISVEFTFS